MYRSKRYSLSWKLKLAGRRELKRRMQYEFHEACLCLPDQSKEEYEELCESIKQGFREHEPILLFEGKILDGRHRYKAAIANNITPIFKQYEGDDPFDYVKKTDFARRHYVSQEQKALIFTDLITGSRKWQETKQKIRKEQKAKEWATKSGKVNKNEPAQPVQVHDDKERQERAKVIGVNRGAIQRADLINKNPELAAQVKSGTMPASKAVQEIQKQKLKTRLDEVATREAIEPTGLYDVIVIDPPWPMQKLERDERPNQVDFDYPTMTEEDMANLQIPADENCHVWLWTTHKFLPMAFRLLDTWKLKYVCCFTWHKPGGFQPFNLPQYNCEFALYARKGAPQFLETKSFPVCFEAPRSGHSAKPQAFYDFINRVTGGRRLDMFNRRAIEGFDVWGKEASNLK